VTCADVAQIIRWRETGISCKECASRIGIQEHQIWRLMRDTGNAGKYRAKQYRQEYRGDSTTMGRAVKSWSEVLVEEGCNGGYVATLGDRVTGRECETVAAAIKDAESR